MTGGGRPLRFLALVMTGWVGARAVMLWPVSTSAVRQALVPKAVAAPEPTAVSTIETQRLLVPTSATTGRSPPPPSIPTAAPLVTQPPGDAVPAEPIDIGPAETPGIVAGLPKPLLLPKRHARARLFGSIWAVTRRGSGPPGGVPGVQLGGSQAGMRLGYALTGDRRLAIVGRASSPLRRGMRELALGVEWQPTRLPLRLVAEQRVALGEGRGGPTLAAVGGVGPVPLIAGFRLEAYAQGGVIARHGAEGFADGALRVARPVATVGRATIDLGGGAWGAAQRGATRVDVGPSLSVVVPVGPQPVRLSLDWRQRVAGNASPGSGPVVTLGADF